MPSPGQATVTAASVKLATTRRRVGTVGALVGQDAVGNGDPRPGPVAQRRRNTPGPQEATVEPEDGVGVGPLDHHRPFGGLGRPGQPRLARPAVAGVGDPGQRRPAAVTQTRIDDPLRGHLGVEQAQLVAGVQERRTPQRQQHDGRDPGALGVAAVPRAKAGRVVVPEHPDRPRRPAAEGGLGLLDHLHPAGGVPRRPQEAEVEDEVQLVPVAVVRGEQPGRAEVDLTDHGPVAWIAVEHRADAAEQLVRAGVVVMGHRRAASRPRRGGRASPGPCR